MSGEQKISSGHLERQVCIYVRQSSLAQVQEHQESTLRQYGLQRRALDLGWQPGQIQTIDEDLGQSASDPNHQRSGFQRLLAEIVSGRVGAVLSVEISRLARQDSEGHRLVELAAFMGSLLIDEDQVYDPQVGDDRLMLGLKVLLSSNEIRVMRQRLQENKVRKAQRGELRLALPVGLVNVTGGGIRLHPDEQVQGAIRLAFERYRLSGSLSAVVRYFEENGLLFPRYQGNWEGPVEWAPLSLSRLKHVLTNPVYAGAYIYGRTRRKAGTTPSGSLQRKPQPLPAKDWQAVAWEAFKGYISRQEYEHNQERLSGPKRSRAQRNGTALLGGLLVCGKCGRRMYVNYGGDGGCNSAYVCSTQQMHYARGVCQRLPAAGLDRAVSQRLLQALCPAQIELSLAAVQELERQQSELHRQWQRRLEDARYAVHLAQRRYEQVDPENRLVARQLEQAWENCLQKAQRLEGEYSQFCQAQPPSLSAEQRKRLVELAQDFPLLWQAETTSWAERKSLIELLIADVTVTRTETEIEVRLRWPTNQLENLSVTLPIRGSPKTPERIMEPIRQMYQTHTDQQIAERLNQEGIRSSYGKEFTERGVADTRRRNGLRKPRVVESV